MQCGSFFIPTWSHECSFPEYYNTYRYVSIDMMIGTRCWVAFLQYMPKKTTSGHPISFSLCRLSASIKRGLTAGLCETSWTYVLAWWKRWNANGGRTIGICDGSNNMRYEWPAEPAMQAMTYGPTYVHTTETNCTVLSGMFGSPSLVGLSQHLPPAIAPQHLHVHSLLQGRGQSSRPVHIPWVCVCVCVHACACVCVVACVCGVHVCACMCVMWVCGCDVWRANSEWGLSDVEDDGNS